MKKIITLCFFALLLFAKAQTPNFQWAKKIGGNLGDYASDIAIDSHGNVNTSGGYRGIVDFDPGAASYTLGAIGSQHSFISKLDPFGNFMWAKTMDGDSSQFSIQSITINKLDEIYITGDFSDTIDFDPGSGTYTIACGGATDAYVLKLDVNGNFMWAKSFSGSGYKRGLEIRTDNAGNVYSCGYFNATTDFDPGAASYTLASAGSNDIFISKLDALGNFVWAKSFSGSGVQDFGNIAIDNTGSIIVTGRLFGVADFDPGAATYTLSSAGAADVFVCKLDLAGNFVWAENFGGASTDEPYAITIDNAGSIYISGDYYGSTAADFDPGPGTYTMTPVSGGLDLFIIKLTGTGNFKWVRSFTGVGAETAYTIDYDAHGGIYTAGCFSSSTDFDPGPGTFNLSTAGFYDIFISKLDTAGNFMWARSMGGSTNETANDLTVDAYGNVFTSGIFQTTVDFDFDAPTYNLTSAGDYDVFIHKINNCNVPSAPVNVTPVANQTVCTNNTTTLTATSTGTINWYTAITPTISGTGANYITPALTPGTYTFYAQAQNCSATSSLVAITVTVDLCTGIHEIKNELSGINVYPNPTKDDLSIIMNFEGEKEIVIFDIRGKLIKQMLTNEKQYMISLSGNPAGLYLLRVNSLNGNFNSKIIKE